MYNIVEIPWWNKEDAGGISTNSGPEIRLLGAQKL